MRTLYKKPIRYTTEESFPEKISLSEFVAVIRNIDAFEENLAKFAGQENKYVENWLEIFAAWLEIEQE